jgi:hypothetical protein
LLGGAVVVGALLMLRVVPAVVRAALTAEERLQERSALLVRTRADLAAAVLLRDSAEQLSRALVELAPRILSGNSAAEAMADLSGRINLAATNHHAKLERVDPVADSGLAGKLRRATLRVAFECDVRGLVGILEALEFGKAALVVRELRVIPVDPGSPDRTPERLRIELVVTGWFLGDRDAEVGTRGMPKL